MFVSTAEAFKYATSGLGVYFYDSGLHQVTAPTFNMLPLNVAPQISYINYGLVFDTANWVYLTGNFIADSAYDNMVIGLFQDTAQMIKYQFNPTGGNYSYYFIDSVEVKLANYLALMFSDTTVCKGDSVSVPFVAGNNHFNSNNVFTLQLSNASGSFANPVNLASVSSTTSGIIKALIPASTPTGSGYRLRVISSNPSDTSEDNGKNIHINGHPPVIASGTTSVCLGNTISLSASGTGLSYGWIGPNSFVSILQNPVLNGATYAASGNYIVTASFMGCSSKDTIAVTIMPSPAVPIASANTPICAGATLNLSSTNSGSSVSYSWIGPGNYSANIQNPSISNTSTAHSGDYIVTAVIGSCTAKDTISVLVKPIPATPTAGNNGPICSGQNLNLTASSATNGVSYTWVGPVSFSSTTQNPTRTNSTTAMSGTYSVTATLNGCTSPAGTTNATVNQTPATPTAGSNSPVCAGAAINLTASSATSGVSYSWTGPGGFNDNNQNPSISPATTANAGVYDVIATLNGCISQAGTTTVTINNVSSIGAYPSPNDTICENNKSATLVAVPNNAGSSPQYQWYKNGNIINGATSLSYPATGIATGDTFHCRLIAAGICSSPLTLFSNKIGMTVLPNTGAPTVSISAMPGLLLSPWQLVTFTATPGGNAGPEPKYQWKRNGQNVSGATADKWSANNLSDKDTISCVITSSEWCALPGSVESNKLGVNIKLGIDDVGSSPGINIYPNPSEEGWNVSVESKAGRISSVLYNAMGAKLWEVADLPAQFYITNQSLPKGLYHLVLRVDGTVHNFRVLK